MEEGDYFVEEINIKDLLNYFLTKLWLLIIIVLGVLIIGNAYSLFIKVPLYQSKTKLVLVSESNAQTGMTQNDVMLNNNLVATYSEMIKSRDILKQVINNLGLKDESTESLSNRINVSTTANTQTIIISVSDTDGETAKLICDEVARVFTKEIVKIYRLDNVHVYEKAIVSNSPYNMNIAKDNVIYLLLGIVVGGGIIFLFFFFDTTIKSSEDIEEKMELNLLGIVPKVSVKAGEK